MNDTNKGRTGARRGQLLPAASANVEERFLDPFDGQRDANEAILICRGDGKLRRLLTESDMEQIRLVVANGSDPLGDGGIASIKKVVANWIDIIWKQLEQAWGVTFDADDRAAIKNIVDRYFDFATFEANAAPISTAQLSLDDFEEKASVFTEALKRLFNGNDSERFFESPISIHFENCGHGELISMVHVIGGHAPWL